MSSSTRGARKTAGTGKAVPAAPEPAAAATPRPRGRSRDTGLVVEAPITHVRSAAAEPATMVRPEPPFFYAYHPARLTVRDGRVVPAFIRLSAEPGVGNVGLAVEKNTGRRIPVVQQAIASAQERGLAVIAWDVDKAAGVPSYIARDRRSGGWFDRWTRVYSGSDHVTYDEAGFADWCESLYERGILERPQIWAMEALANRLVAMLSKIKPENPDRAVLEAQIKAIRDELVRARAEEEALELELGADPGVADDAVA